MPDTYATTWQPIKTAPKDGTTILVYQPAGMWASRVQSRGECVVTAHWHQPGNPERHGLWFPICRPTHWMPLPEPPK